MATNFTGGDALTAFAGGALDEVMRRRKLREAQAQQSSLLAQQQAGATERTALEQQGMADRTGYVQGQMNDRTAATIAGANARADGKPAPAWRPTTKAEYKEMIDYKHSLKSKDAGSSDEKGIDSQVKRLTDAWSKDVENTRRGDTYIGADFKPHPRAHMTGSRTIPTYGGEDLPQDKWDEVAKTSVTHNISTQKAADMVYARDSADEAGAAYGVNPAIGALDVAKLRSLPSMHGRSINLGGEDGKTSLYDLMGVLIGSAGWTHQEISDLLDEYYGVGATQAQPQDIIQSVTGAK